MWFNQNSLDVTHEVKSYISWLKSSFHLVCRNFREQSDTEMAYGTQLNGDSQRAPPWPQPQDDNEIMFLLPRKLGNGDTVIINGILKTNRTSMLVNLITGNTSPDQQNIACQFEALFPNDANNTDKIIIRVIQNGIQEIIKGSYEDTTTADLFTDNKFTFSITLRIVESNFGDYENIPVLDIYIDGSHLQQVQLKHNLDSIKFLTMKGSIEKVNSLHFELS